MSGIYSAEPFLEEDMLGGHMADLINDSVAKNGDNKAFSCVLPSGHTATLTFNEIGLYTDQIAAYLREELGLRPGDVVALQSPNALAYPVVAFGVLKAGLTITNVNPLYTLEETQYQLQDSRAKLLFVVDVFGDRLKQSVEGTAVEKVFKLSLVDFFPPLQKKLLSFVMRRIKKLIPEPSRAFDNDLDTILKRGAYHLRKGADLQAYRAQAKPTDIAFYQYTGGTTGRSKGAELTQYNLVANISQGHKRTSGILGGAGETMALILPLYHVYALAVGAVSSMCNGTHVVLVPAPRPVSNLKPLFEKFDITTMPGVNTLYLALLQESWFIDNPPKTFRYCFSGGAPLQPQTAAEWERVVGLPIYEGYGLTESTCVVSSSPLDAPPKKGSCGKPIPGTELRIVDSDGKDRPPGEAGELWVRGPQIMKGYLRRPEATREAITEEGWFKTGDVAILDEDGYLSIVDRIKDMVIVSGFNVYPTDIEDVLTRHPDVGDAAVVGVPSNETGEKLIAYIVPKEETLTAAELGAHCREHLTGYKIPKTYEFMQELPKSPVGKVLRREVRKIALEKFAAKGDCPAEEKEEEKQQQQQSIA